MKQLGDTYSNLLSVLSVVSIQDTSPGASSASGFDVSTVVLTKASHLSLGTTLCVKELENTYMSDLLFTCLHRLIGRDCGMAGLR